MGSKGRIDVARKTSPRLEGYDYSSVGFYFVTICTAERISRFGEVRSGEMNLNRAGELAQLNWLDLPNHYPNLKLDEFIVMPNHLHAIAILKEPRRFKNLSAANKHGLSEIIRGFKTWSARRINEAENSAGSPVWQRSFYDHIIEGDKELENIRAYIVNNPTKWDLDQENPTNLKRYVAPASLDGKQG